MEKFTEKFKDGYIPLNPLFTASMCDKLGQYEDLEEQGKLLKLPCAVGDTVYTFSFYRVLKMHVECFVLYKDHIDARLASNTPENPFLTVEIDIAELGKRWFLTESEAQAAINKE